MLNNYLKKTLILIIILILCIPIASLFIKSEPQNNEKYVFDEIKEEVIDNNNDNIEIDDIAPYYQESTLNVAAEVNALSDDYVSFIVVTDTHGTKNKNNSQNIARYLLKNTKADRLFHLGDSVASTWNESDYRLYFDSFNNCKQQVFYTLGNHETYESTNNDIEMIYNDLLLCKEYLHGSPEKFYYYFDDVESNIRYLIINTSDTSNEQIEWINKSVKLPSDDWKLIVFGHMDIIENDPIMWKWVAPMSKDIADALSSTNGTIVGYFCGHEHCDLINKVEDKFYEIILLNDSCEADDTFDEIINPERIEGTNSENAISVVSINTVDGSVEIKRIGAGENLTYNYFD